MRRKGAAWSWCWPARTTPRRCWRACTRAAPQAPKTPREWRRLGLGAQILVDLGVHRLRVLGTPRKLVGLAGFGLEVVGYEEAAPDA